MKGQLVTDLIKKDKCDLRLSGGSMQSANLLCGKQIGQNKANQPTFRQNRQQCLDYTGKPTDLNNESLKIYILKS